MVQALLNERLAVSGPFSLRAKHPNLSAFFKAALEVSHSTLISDTRAIELWGIVQAFVHRVENMDHS